MPPGPRPKRRTTIVGCSASGHPFATRRVATMAFAAALVAGACSGAAARRPRPHRAPRRHRTRRQCSRARSGASPAAGGAVTGSIIVSGSSTVEPISTGVAEAFKAAATRASTTRSRAPAPATASRSSAPARPTSPTPRARSRTRRPTLCQAAGIEYVELKIAHRRHHRHDLARQHGRHLPELRRPVRPDRARSRTGFAKWSDAAALAKELGSNTTFPDAAAGDHRPRRGVRHLRQLRRARDHRRSPRSAARRTRPRGPTTRPRANDNAIIEGVAGSDTSLGWVGFAFAEENADKVNELQVAKDANGTCVAPTAETIADGSYPLSRALYIYVNKAKAAANPAVVALRRLLPRRWHHLDGPRDRPVREPPGRRRSTRVAGRLGRR